MQTTIFLLVTKHGDTASSNQRFENQTKCCSEIEAKVTDVQTSYETAFLELSNNVTEIKTEQYAHKSTILVLDTRLKQLESVIDDGTCNNTMLQDIDVRILQLDATNYSKNITELQNQMSIHNTRITHLEENGQNISDVIYNLGTSIKQIESSRTEDQENIKAINKIIMRNITELNLNIANLEMNSTQFKTDIQDLYTNISEIESDEAWNLALTFSIIVS